MNSPWTLKLIDLPDAPYRHQHVDGVDVLAPPANPDDYFTRSGLHYRIDGTNRPEGLYLLIEHLDRNIGVIQVQYDSARNARPDQPEFDPVYAHAGSVAGFTALGTGQRRRALFHLPSPGLTHRQAGGADIKIMGVESVVQVSLLSELPDGLVDEVLSDIPQPETLKPQVELTRPIQLVITAGTDRPKPDELHLALEQMRDLCPLAKVLGFNGIEGYVKWNFVEKADGVFDWSYYDGVVTELKRHGLRWFPLLIVGSAYALPEWFYERTATSGFACLEHGESNDIPTIFNDDQIPYVKRFLKAFGDHYEPMDILLGVRLGPSGNYGESQYPATGQWGYNGQKHHIHIGWWAGDPFAAPRFQGFLQKRYARIDALNEAWGSSYPDFDSIEPFVPTHVETHRKRKDLVDWYMDAMSDWCEKWAIWAREGMPNTSIYQSSGGWGFAEAGTDFTEQTRSMTRISGGIRSTNEADAYALNFSITRMMSSAARFYGVPYGSEPAGFGSAQGVVARLYNTMVNDAQHLFYYHPNVVFNDQGVERWLKHAPLLDLREPPLTEVAALYPDTMAMLDDSVIRYINASAWVEQSGSLRNFFDYDFCSERMIRDGALARYKALVFLSRFHDFDVVEADALEAIDAWIREGGTAIYPYIGARQLRTVEGDRTIYGRWLRGDTGKGQVLFDRRERRSPNMYSEFVRDRLVEMSGWHPATLRMLQTHTPEDVYLSALQSGVMVALNYRDEPVDVAIPGCEPVTVLPYTFERIQPQD